MSVADIKSQLEELYDGVEISTGLRTTLEKLTSRYTFYYLHLAYTQ